MLIIRTTEILPAFSKAKPKCLGECYLELGPGDEVIFKYTHTDGLVYVTKKYAKENEIGVETIDEVVSKIKEVVKPVIKVIPLPAIPVRQAPSLDYVPDFEEIQEEQCDPNADGALWPVQENHCTLCKQDGHDTDHCSRYEKCINPNCLAEGSIHAKGVTCQRFTAVCTRCGGKYHFASECKAEACGICGRFNHKTEEHNGDACKKCGEYTHQTGHCRNYNMCAHAVSGRKCVNGEKPHTFVQYSCYPLIQQTSDRKKCDNPVSLTKKKNMCGHFAKGGKCVRGTESHEFELHKCYLLKKQ